MQRERSTFNSFPEPIDLNQGSLPINSSLDHSTSWDNVLNPVENRLSNYMLASANGNANFTSGNDFTQSFSGWDHGETSSSANNLQDGTLGDRSKMSLGWSASFNAYSGSGARSENGPFGPFGATSYVGNQLMASNRSFGMHNYSSNHAFMNVTSNRLTWDYDPSRGVGAGLAHSFHKPGHSEMEQIPTLNASSSNAETFSGSFFQETDNASWPSFDTWGSSCKRKALEGTSRQFGPGGSSSSSQMLGKNTMQHPVPVCYSSGPGNLSISSGPLTLSPINQSELLSPSNGIGVSRVAPVPFPSSSVSGTTETSARNFTINSNDRQHDSVAAFDTPRGAFTRNFGVHAAQMSRTISNMDSFGLRLPMNHNDDSQPYLMHVNDPRGIQSNPWNGCSSGRGGSSLSASMVSGERGSVAHEEVNVRSSRRNNLEHLMAVSVPETRNILQDQIDWSFAPGSSSRNHSSGSRVGHSSSGWASSSWLPYQTPSSQNHQRASESTHWIPYPYVEAVDGTQRSHFAHFPPSSLADGAASTSRGSQHQLHQSTAAFLMSMPSDDINSWHSMTAGEGRNRLIRQVLNAMRRGSRVQAEDYMIDPYMDGYAEIHDRHRDMRLDVDNMSYEELLALEERIGNVSTGLSEKKINSCMKRRIYEAMAMSQKLEPCCICQIREFFFGIKMAFALFIRSICVEMNFFLSFRRNSLLETILEYWTAGTSFTLDA